MNKIKKKYLLKKKVPNNKPKDLLKDIPTAGDGWTNDLKKHIDKKKIQKDRLNPHYKLNFKTNAKLESLHLVD